MTWLTQNIVMPLSNRFVAHFFFSALVSAILFSPNLLTSAYAQTYVNPENSSASLTAPQEGPLLYDREYPIIGYSTRQPEDPIARIQQRLIRGELKFESNASHGYLDDLLKALELDKESQVLVFSSTSINVSLVRANNPRAIYFNDDTYIAWVPGADEIEIATMDPNLGPVFYTLDVDNNSTTGFVRHAGRCLRCHDSLTLTGGGVPRFILGSGYTYFNGSLASHEGWILTTQETPLRFRWGGWYVTGKHGDQVHLGNIVVKNPQELQDLESMRKGNLETIADFIIPENYLSSQSDIDALMVLQHQVQVQNLITRVNYDIRNALLDSFANESGEINLTEEKLAEIKTIIEPLIMAMLMTDEAEIQAPITGNSGFRSKFEKRGPFDSNGRSLRELDLNTRLFRYPLSYLIYSEAFDALPDIAQKHIYQRLNTILTGPDNNNTDNLLSDEDRVTIKEILIETKPEFVKFAAEFDSGSM